MKRFNPLTSSLAVLALLALGTGLVQAQAGGDASPTDLEGKAAPAVSLETLDGKDVKLADMKGKVVLVDFWATWCSHCLKSLPHVQEMSRDKALAAKGLVVWAVNAREAPEKVTPFMQQNKYSFTVPMDAGGDVMKSYHVTGIPTTVVIGRDGTVKKAFVGYGPDSAEQIKAAVDQALAEGDPSA